MKNLLKSVVLSIALLLPFAAFAEGAVEGKTIGKVVNENEKISFETMKKFARDFVMGSPPFNGLGNCSLTIVVF